MPLSWTNYCSHLKAKQRFPLAAKRRTHLRHWFTSAKGSKRGGAMSFELVDKIMKINAIPLHERFCQISPPKEHNQTSASAMKFVLLSLASFKNKKDPSRPINPSLSTLKERTGLSKRTIMRAIDALLKIRIIHEISNNAQRRKPNHYDIQEADIDSFNLSTSDTMSSVKQETVSDSLMTPCHQLVTLCHQTGATMTYQPGTNQVINQDCGKSTQKNSSKKPKQPSVKKVNPETFCLPDNRFYLNFDCKMEFVELGFDQTHIKDLLEDFTEYWKSRGSKKTLRGWHTTWLNNLKSDALQKKSFLKFSYPNRSRAEEIPNLENRDTFLKLAKDTTIRYHLKVQACGGFEAGYERLGFPPFEENDNQPIAHELEKKYA